MQKPQTFAAAAAAVSEDYRQQLDPSAFLEWLVADNAVNSST
jgi:hypothetical protein